MPQWPMAVVALLLLPGLAIARPSCPPAAPGAEAFVFNARLDNDLLGMAGQDQGYSNGAVVSVVSPAATADSCIGRLAGWLDLHGVRLQPQDERRSLTLSVGQGIFTPRDPLRRDPIAGDRPYAAVIMLGLGANVRDGDRLRSTHLRLGMVGPSARGQEVQNAVHGAFGVERFRGWDHQLRDGPVWQWLHERMRRRPSRSAGTGWGWDRIDHAGVSLGNFVAHANAGAEWRWGWRLPDDFGSNPLRPAGEHTAVLGDGGDARSWAWHLFAGVDARWIGRDMTLDGSAFQEVSKRTWVGDLGYGIVVMRGRWRMTVAQYRRTREFDGQRDPPVFGSVSLSRAF